MSRRIPIDADFPDTAPINIWSDAFAAAFRLFRLPKARIQAPPPQHPSTKRSPRQLTRWEPSTCG